MRLKTFVVALAVSSAVPLFSQVVPSATENRLQLKIGAGFSDYYGDLGNGWLIGGALWIDGVPPHLPRALYGLGLEVEARGVQANKNSPTEYGVFRQATLGGGATYTWHHYRTFRPYAKFIVSLAGQNFNIGDKGFHHDSQVAYAPGGGVDYAVTRNLWVRADYEYQIWPDAFGVPNWYLDPQGFSVGLLWDFRPLRER
ncbi:MAG: outer membrane protein [Terracidiphilus sp.]